MFDFDEQKQNWLFMLLYAGSITVSKLPLALYKAIGNNLQQGIYKGFDIDIKYNVPDTEMIRELRENVWIFSGAKTYQEVKEMSSLLTVGGKLLPFNEYKKLVKNKFDLYNDTYQKTEYNFAVGQSQNARKWEDVEAHKKAMPLLKYVTVHDGNVSEICQALDGVVRPVDDPFWSAYMPMNHFNCRCIAQQGDAQDMTITAAKHPPIDDLFNYNPGKSRVIFKPEHPYFQVEQKDKELAKRNFNLPIPK